MKGTEKSNIQDEKKSTMTLKDYFESLPESRWETPRKDFIRKVSEKCDVIEQTAENWMRGYSGKATGI